MKKQKGISLIVLIITIVVIIILAASIILNLSKTNIIGNANTAVLKSDIATLQSELDLYVSDRFVDEKGEYDRIKLNADQTSATYGTEKIEDKNDDGSSNIYDILTSLEKSKYKNNVYIQEGKLVFKNSGLADKEIKIILEMGLEVDGMPKVTSIDTNSTYTSIEVTLNVILSEEVEKYVYILNDGEREESTLTTKTYTGLTSGVNYTLEVILVLKDGTEISKKEIISTKNIDGEITYTLSETEWTKEDVTVTLTYSEETMPEGYVLQYRTKDVDGNTIQDWTEYTTPVVITTNNTSVVGRLYNETLSDEKIPSDITVSKIDKTAPIIDSIEEGDVTDSSFNVNIEATDTVSGIQSYTLYVNGEEYDTVKTNEKTVTILVSDRKGNTTYTCYASVKDKAGNETTSAEISIVTPADSTPPTIELVNVEYVGTEYAKVTLRVKDESSEVKNILKDGNVILDASLEKLEDNLYVYNVINNGEVIFTATDTSDNVNTTGVSVNISGLKYDSLVKYVDKLLVENFIVKRTASSYANVGYSDYTDSEYLKLYRSASGTNYVIFSKQLDMKQGNILEMNYDMFHDGSGGTLSYAFIQNVDDYSSATYTKIDTATTNSNSAVAKTAKISFDGEEGKYYLVLAISHTDTIYTTNVRIYDLKMYNDSIAPTIELVNVEYVGTEYANITLRIKDNFSGVASILKNGIEMDDTSLEKLEDDLYVYKTKINKDFKFTAIDEAGNVNEEGVTVTIDKLTNYEVGLVSYTDKLNVADITVHASSSSYTNNGYSDYTDSEYLQLYRSASGTNYIIFNEKLDMFEGIKLTIDYDIYDNYGGSNGTFSYAFVQDTTAYASASYTTIATSTSKTPTRTSTTIDYTGDEGEYYLVLKLNHPLSVYTTNVRLYELKIHI